MHTTNHPWVDSTSPRNKRIIQLQMSRGLRNPSVHRWTRRFIACSPYWFSRLRKIKYIKEIYRSPSVLLWKDCHYWSHYWRMILKLIEYLFCIFLRQGLTVLPWLFSDSQKGLGLRICAATPILIECFLSAERCCKCWAKITEAIRLSAPSSREVWAKLFAPLPRELTKRVTI